MSPKQVAIVGFEDMMSLDLTGPLEAFTSARIESPSGRHEPCYKVTIAALGAKSFRSESGLRMTASCSLSSLRQVDTLIIPGGRSMRDPAINAKLADWISRSVRDIRRVATVCTGAYGLAATGLLNGRRATTHWMFCRDLAARYPKIKVDANALYIRQGKFYTSAGVTAGIDLSLALIEEDFGPQVALAVARELVVYLKRPGGQEQYSEPLKFQAQSSSRFAELAPWMMAHLGRDLSVERLAEQVCLCPRQFSRRFKYEFKSSPAAFVQRLRLDEARKRLSAAESSVEAVARSVGFQDPDSFRRAFVKRFGVAPSTFRGRFVTGRG
ncbi:MAG TPA: GlxA family transcriptional regulator [Candidatus Binatia bacterium]|nr:GlxA family transcriptional regulator [Candidatus Binatia bacterium]